MLNQSQCGRNRLRNPGFHRYKFIDYNHENRLWPERLTDAKQYSDNVLPKALVKVFILEIFVEQAMLYKPVTKPSLRRRALVQSSQVNGHYADFTS